MNEDSIGSKLEGFVLWAIVMVMVFLWLGILFAPIFLPMIRSEMEKKYEKFDHKNNLVAEEMSSCKTIAWSACIIGWIATITYLLTVGL